MSTPRFVVRRSARNTYDDLSRSVNVLRFKKRCHELAAMGLEVGWPEGAKDKNGTPLSLIAAVNHFGATIPIKGGGTAPGHWAAPRTAGVIVIPERPALTIAMRSGKGLFQRLNKRNIALVLQGKMEPLVAIKQLGAAAVGEVQKTIRHGDLTPNAPSTIAAKGSSQPLVNDGALWQGVTFEVKEGVK
jgi:hypothetical protein